MVYLHLVKDPVFNHWRKEDENDEDSYIIFTLNTLFTFKATRLFYCRLFDKKYFHAASEDMFRTFIRPIWLLSMVGVIPVFAILIADIYTIWNLRWGYEIKALAVESIILSIVIFGLESYEYIRYRNQQPKYLAPH